jgi:CubicO group peptidase (beta-lactamase class C family)
MPRSWRVAGVALVGVVGLHTGVGAQGLAVLLFDRYLEPLRIQAGIPGLAAAIVQDGVIVWERGLGQRDIEASLPVQPDTPFAIADLTQTLTATLLLKCSERGEVRLDDAIGKYAPSVPEPGTTLQQLLVHASPNPGKPFKYDPGRFALLAAAVETCGEQPYRKIVAQEILDRLVMADSIPGRDILTAAPEVRQLFDATVLDRYAAALKRLATPYKVDRRGRAARGDFPDAGIGGSHGLIASVRDLAEFDKALDNYILLRAETVEASRTNATHNGTALPTGQGWFVQTYQGERLVWHFGVAPDAFSSMILKIPSRRLTLILLANSDGLSTGFSLADGDVTSSLFARTFLHFFL